MLGDFAISSPPRSDVAWGRRFFKRLRADAGLQLGMSLFWLAAFLISEELDRHYITTLTAEYLGVYLGCACGIIALAMACSIGARLIIERPSGPFAVVEEMVEELATPEAVAGLFLFAQLAVFMGAFTSLKTVLPLINSFWADPALAALDRTAFLGKDAWQVLQPLLGHHWVTQTIEFIYGPLWMLMMVSFPMYFCVFATRMDLRRRFMRGYVSAWVVSGSLLAVLFMSGGPAFFGPLTGDHDHFAALLDYLKFDAASPISAYSEQKQLWKLYSAYRPGLGAGISAFPSMHVSMVVLFALAATELDRRLGAVMWVMAGVIVLGSIHLAWHYLFGDIGAASVATALWWFSGKTPAKGGSRPRRAQPRLYKRPLQVGRR